MWLATLTGASIFLKSRGAANGVSGPAAVKGPGLAKLISELSISKLMKKSSTGLTCKL